jgi:hypothetical protein
MPGAGISGNAATRVEAFISIPLHPGPAMEDIRLKEP